jgi:hypothetical protein
VFEFTTAVTGNGVLIEIVFYYPSNLCGTSANWSPCDHLDLSLSF